MAKQRDRDELDDTLPYGDEDARGMGDELDEDDDDEDEVDDEFDEADELDEDERLTSEVGNEGGSFGERVRTHRRYEPFRGSEATETARRRR